MLTSRGKLIVGRIEQIYVHLARLFQMSSFEVACKITPHPGILDKLVLSLAVQYQHSQTDWDSSTDTMLALQTLSKPLFSLYEIDWRIRSPQPFEPTDLG